MIYFNKETKTGKYYIINTDSNGAITGKNQKMIMDLLDEYAVKLDSISKVQK